MKPPCNAWSAITSDTIDSTTGGARGTTHVSCLPSTLNFVFFLVLRSTVSWILPIDEAGLKATRITIGIPFDMPPKIPPALFVLVIPLPLRNVYESLFCEPCFSDPENPEPNSTPLTAGIE